MKKENAIKSKAIVYCKTRKTAEDFGNLNNHQHFAFIKRKKRILEKEVQDSFGPFNTYLWIHFVGYTENLTMAPRSLIITAASVLLSVINDGYNMIFFIMNLLRIIKYYNKDSLLRCIMEIGEFILRIAVCLNRQKIQHIVEQLAALYSHQAKENLPNLKAKIASMLLMNDLYYSIWLIMGYLDTVPNREVLSYFEEDYFIFVPPPYSKPLSYLFDFMHHMNMLSPFVAIFFCFVCYMLKHTLLEFKKNLENDRNLEATRLFRDYNEITDMISSFNSIYHNLLLASLTMLLVWLFYSTYNLFFVEMGSTHDTVSCVLLFVGTFTQFAAICLCASSVTKAVSDVNEAIYLLPFDVVQVGNLPFLLKASREFHGFKVFDQIIIDKSLILSAVGSLLTYGILLATFNVSS